MQLTAKTPTAIFEKLFQVFLEQSFLPLYGNTLSANFRDQSYYTARVHSLCAVVRLHVFFVCFFFNLGCYRFQKTEISDLSVLDPLASPASTSLPPPRDITTFRQLLHIWSGPPRQLRPHNAPCQVHLTMRTRNIDVIQRPFFPPKTPISIHLF